MCKYDYFKCNKEIEMKNDSCSPAVLEWLFASKNYVTILDLFDGVTSQKIGVKKKYQNQESLNTNDERYKVCKKEDRNWME